MPLYIVTFGIAIARLTLVTYNTVQISKLETKIATKDKNIDHLFDITKLCQVHFKSTDEKVEKINNTPANLLQVN
jgi:peptidoglycan hydrolase CwlO-like protein